MRIEANIDALVGPTHHFGGMGVGNVASHASASQPSHPKQAALEGLSKAEMVAKLGVPQFIWLPPLRPEASFFSRLGFGRAGADKQEVAGAELHAALAEERRVLSAAFSSAFMWAANAGTFTPDVDSSDARHHFTPANLISSWHRAFEAPERQLQAESLFGRLPSAVVHDPLPPIVPLRDEGAANHMRLSTQDGMSAIHVFVHGSSVESEAKAQFFPRHTDAASRALARLHALPQEDVFFFQQSAEAISAGVFHNDVIATSHRNLLIYHETAFAESSLKEDWARMLERFSEKTGESLHAIRVSAADFSLEEAVGSYFFNSQILTPQSDAAGLPGSSGILPMQIVCPEQCRQSPAVKNFIDRLIADPSNPIQQAHFVSLMESMANGGGPACLRLRMQLSLEEIHGLSVGGVQGLLRATDENLDRVRTVVDSCYPDRVVMEDLTSCDLVESVHRAHHELHALCGV
ncbi:MAG: N-succinylarginine dihydrolase [Planctomycetota bacterium]